MAYNFKLPDVGEGIHEAVVVQWLISAGAAVKEDQPFVSVETDKAVVELPSPVAGFVGKQHFKPGDIVHVGDVLVTFTDSAESPQEAVSDEDTTAGKDATPGDTKKSDSTGVTKKKQDVTASETESGESDRQSGAMSRRPLATPHTRALARRLGVDLKDVKPSGKGGRITDEDVEKTAQGPEEHTTPSTHKTTTAPSSDAQSATPPAAPRKTTQPVGDSSAKAPKEPLMSGTPADTEWGPVERVKISRLRQVIARNMSASKHTLAHVTHVDETDVTDLAALYKKVKQQVEDTHDVKFTIMPFFIKAVVTALKKHPTLNASFDDEAQEMILKHYYNVGFATDTPEGLIVPVIHNADHKDMIAIAHEIADKAARAKERKLTLDEMQGAGFTITNVGAMGGIFATPVIPLPQLAILGMHAMKDRPVVRNGEIVIRKMMNLSITFDHRMIDGMAAAYFLREVIGLIENPEMLILRLV